MLVGVALLPGCSGGGGPDVSGLSPTWNNVYGSVISKRCLPCHASSVGATQGLLNMGSKATAYANLVGVASKGSACAGQATRVVAGDASSSLLYLKLGNPPCGSRMPLGMASLSSSEKNLIKKWIDGGAKND